ncbi:MAG: SLC13 family permease [Candidatus Competibacteraceae bacterium]|nr:SLC13 family permease [Candidatus Competibacteraceae bacterium]
MALTVDMVVVLGLVGLTACLFITEWVRADVAAVLVLAPLGFCSIILGLEEAVRAQTLFSGFASDAVMAIIAVMIIGAGLDRTGIMHRLAGWIVALGGHASPGLRPGPQHPRSGGSPAQSPGGGDVAGGAVALPGADRRHPLPWPHPSEHSGGRAGGGSGSAGGDR